MEDARVMHESMQDDEKLFNALCPANKKGEGKATPSQLAVTTTPPEAATIGVPLAAPKSVPECRRR